MKRTQLVGLILLLVFATAVFGLESKAYDKEIRPVSNYQYQAATQTSTSDRETAATISWLDEAGIVPNTNFGGWTNDYFMEYFVPAADGYITSIDFNFSDLPAVTGGGMSIWIYDFAYGWSEITTTDIAGGCGDAHLGYYDEATGFEVVGSNWVQGGINAVEGADPAFNYDPLGSQLWPAFGAASVSIEPNADDEGIVNVDPVAVMGTTYNFTRGNPFIIVTRFNGFPDDGDADDTRMGFYSGLMTYEAQPSLKFYSDISSPTGRCGTNDWGWYIREYVWDWKVNVAYTGDRPPVITDVTNLAVTLSTDARTVSATITDDNPGGGAAGVASAELMYSLNGGEYMSVTMTADADTFSADIPGQSGGTSVAYYIMATDAEGLVAQTFDYGYDVFGPSAPTLVFFNGGSAAGYPGAYYFGASDGPWPPYSVAPFPHDTWEVAPTAELFSAFTTIYEIAAPNAGPSWDTRDLVNDWLAEGAKNYFLAGDEIFGAWTGWADQAYEAGSFEYDKLGVAYIYNDINAATDSSEMVAAVAGNALTGDMATGVADSGHVLVYDPYYELGENNWLDAFDAVDAASVNMTYAGASDGMNGKAVGMNHTVDDDNIVFLAYDPLALDSHDPVYYWWGFSLRSATTQSLEEWGIWAVSVDETDLGVRPDDFKLGAAYPNPFNPSTSFEYSVPVAGDVNITIYNTLGQEVATLVEGHKAAGSYLVNWNAGNAASGLYFYRMSAPGFTATQKMLLLK